MNDKSLILKLRLVLKLSKASVCSECHIDEILLESIETKKYPPPKSLIKYYSVIASVDPKYLNALFYKNDSALSKTAIKLINGYFDLIFS